MEYDIFALVIRSLNYARKEFLPTYIGLRILLDSVPQVDSCGWFRRYIEGKNLYNRHQSYFPYEIFKSFEEGDFKYRKCFSCSPTSLLAEAYALNILSKCHNFCLPGNVYSYKWPCSERSGSMYQYFFDGYYQREINIQRALQENKNGCLVSCDIKAFYPSINKKDVMEKFKQEIIKGLINKSQKHYVIKTAEQLLSVDCPGVPIGSPFGHVLGHIALSGLDKELISKYKDNYFRYVDDISIVVDYNEKDAVCDFLNNSVKKYGYKLNHGKTCFIESKLWKSPFLEINRRRGVNFSRFRQMITYYLLLNPDSFKSLQSTFTSAGITFPLSIIENIKYSRLLQYLKIIFSKMTPFQKFEILSLDESKLVKMGIDLKRTCYKTLEDDFSSPIPEDNFQRKFFIQKSSSMIRKLLYLEPVENLKNLLPYTNNIPEMHALEQLLVSLTTRTIDNILNLSGPTVNTFAQICSESAFSPFDVNIKTNLNSHSLYAFSVLMAYGLINITDYGFDNDAKDHNQALLSFCSNKKPMQRDHSGFSYIDEVRSLQLNNPSDYLADYFKTRYDKSEDLVLDAFLMNYRYAI